MKSLSITEVAGLRAAIAKHQTRHWERAFWQTAPTKKELDRRERNWFWWGGTGWIAEQAAHGRWLTRDQSSARGR